MFFFLGGGAGVELRLVDELDWLSRSGVACPFVRGIVLVYAAFDVRRDAGIKRVVGAAEDVEGVHES